MEELPKTYNPLDHEQEIYKLWEKSGAFTPKIASSRSSEVGREDESVAGSQSAVVSRESKSSVDKRQTTNNKPFVISMPPPNVTGKLHVGHALFITLEDIMTRYHRMRGEPTLWLPGTDHAGIATQNVVEKQLKKEGLTKRDLGRKRFVKRVWQWKEEYGGEITRQLRRMGASCDWSRERFTLDEGLSEAVNEAFKQLYDKGLIYRGKYIVNWCPRCHSAIADDEVEHKTQIAKLYFFKYDKDFPITIATTRPETKFGDTAVAVNPSDKKYKEFVGKTYKAELDGVKLNIKIIADRAIDQKFGTGALGVTPAHSFADWQMAQSNDLPIIQVIDENARMSAEAGKYEGMKVVEARKKLVEYLKDSGLMEKEEEIENNLSVCYRCNASIEPIPSLQWFVRMKPLAEKAKKAVESGEIKIVPKRFEKVYYHWMDNIRDWCISRQLWWGHRIPVWYKQENQKSKIKNQNDKSKIKKGDLKIMGFAERVVPQVLAGKTKTYRIRDHELKVGDKVYFENSQTGEIFGSGVMAESTKTKVKNLPLRDIAHGAVYKNLDELIEAFKFHYPEKEINPETDAYIYAYDFVPRDQFENCDIENLRHSGLDPESRKEWILNQVQDDVYVGTEPPKDAENWTQDEDVLDTWFSSALWPFSTLGWPNSSDVRRQSTNDQRPTTDISDYEYFYPTTVMETGYDILFFWVARMVMMGLELTGEAPFKTVYLHGLVRDEQNRKMSKSLGNVIEPLEVSDKFGTDAVRMSLVVGTSAGADSKIGEGKIKGYRNFSNKLWNIARFVISNFENLKLDVDLKFKIKNLKLSEPDRDLEKLAEIVKTVTKQLDTFKFSQAGELLYEYTWHEFADKIIEESKERLAGEDEEDKKACLAKLVTILITILKLLHPFVPFVTETIWQEMPGDLKDEKLLISSNWPE